MEYVASIFGFKSAVLIVTDIDASNSTNEVKNIILSYPPITQIMVDSHCEILWADNSEAGLGCHPTENYVSGIDDPSKKSVIAQQRLRINTICP